MIQNNHHPSSNQQSPVAAAAAVYHQQIRLPSIVSPYEDPLHTPQHQQHHTFISLPVNNQNYFIQQQQQQQRQVMLTPTEMPHLPQQLPNWTPSHLKAYSVDSLVAAKQQQHQHHSKSKSVSSTVSNNPNSSNFQIKFPIQKIPLDKLQTVVMSDLNQIPKMMDIATKKYSTAIDSRSFITVYEYQIDNNWIIWDYHTGLVHLTGLWKSIGNKKLDIVKLIDSSPELADVVKRVRGGFLKIQGTWIPYNIAKKLACKFCYDIRFSLIPLFGYDFVNECLKPDQDGFGLLRLDNATSNHKLSKNRRRLKMEQQLLQLQLQLQQQLPMTPYYYSNNQDQLPTPTLSATSSTSSESSITFQNFKPYQYHHPQLPQQLESPLESKTTFTPMNLPNLPKLHTFTNLATNNVLNASKKLQNLNPINTKDLDSGLISPKSSVVSLEPERKRKRKNHQQQHGIHKKLNSTSSINIDTVLQAAIKLDSNNINNFHAIKDDDDIDDDEDEEEEFVEERQYDYKGYDKNVIDAASSLMSVSYSWRNWHFSRLALLSPPVNDSMIRMMIPEVSSTVTTNSVSDRDSNGKSNKMNINGLLT